MGVPGDLRRGMFSGIHAEWIGVPAECIGLIIKGSVDRNKIFRVADVIKHAEIFASQFIPKASRPGFAFLWISCPDDLPSDLITEARC